MNSRFFAEFIALLSLRVSFDSYMQTWVQEAMTQPITVNIIHLLINEYNSLFYFFIFLQSQNSIITFTFS